jgi:hypothetical protein
MLLLVSIAPRVKAQRPLHPEFAAGIAFPLGSLGRRYTPGPLLHVGVLIVDSARVWRLRLDGEVTRLRARPESDPFDRPTGHYRTVSTMASVLVGPTRHVVAPYFLFGAGMQQVHASSTTRRGRTLTAALRAGVGVRANVRRYRFSLEYAKHLVFSGRGTNEDYGFIATYRPITVGVSF